MFDKLIVFCENLRDFNRWMELLGESLVGQKGQKHTNTLTQMAFEQSLPERSISQNTPNKTKSIPTSKQKSSTLPTTKSSPILEQLSMEESKSNKASTLPNQNQSNQSSQNNFHQNSQKQNSKNGSKKDLTGQNGTAMKVMYSLGVLEREGPVGGVDFGVLPGNYEHSRLSRVEEEEVEENEDALRGVWVDRLFLGISNEPNE